jgi:hypothetical protein
MTTFSDQLSAVRKSQWEAQLDIFHTLTSRALDSASQLIDLQLRASRTSVEQVTGTFKQLLDASNPRDFVAVGSRAQGQWHYLFSYGRELFGIASGVGTNAWKGNPTAASSLNPALTSPLLITAPTANVPTSIPQAFEQASIATAGATTLHSELAAAAVDTGAALAEATLQAGTDVVARAADTVQQPKQEQEQQPKQEQEQPKVAQEQQPAPAEASPLPESAAEAAIHFAEAASETAIADAVPHAAETPLAQALHEIAPTPVSAQHPVASTLILQAEDHVELPQVAPVDAAPPAHVPAPPAAPKSTRSSRRK